MATFRIEQYAGMAVDHGGRGMQMPVLPMLGTAENVTTSGISAASATLDPKTRAIRVRTTGGNVAFRVGSSTVANPIALVTDTALNDGEVAWFAIDPAMTAQSAKLAVIDR